jgi:hypothetical protein
MEESKSSPRTD